MARIRTLKPSFYSHEQLSALPAEWHMLAGALLNYADDHGYFNANPQLVHAGTMPLRTFDVAAALDALRAVNFVRFGLHPDGRRFGHVINFYDHQKVDKPTKSQIADMPIAWERKDATPSGRGRFSASQLPLESEDATYTGADTAAQGGRFTASADSPTPRGGLGEGSTTEEEEEKEGNKEGNKERSTDALAARFARFYAAYPKHVSKAAAWKAWQRLKPSDELLTRMLVALERHRRLPQWTKNGGEFVPHPATWLNQCRWEDEVPASSSPSAVPDVSETRRMLDQAQRRAGA